MKKILTTLLMLSFSLGNASAYTSTQLNAAELLASQWVINTQESPEGYELDSFITRKEISKIIGKLSGNSIAENCDGIFSDVDSDWGCKYIEHIYKAGVISFNSEFRPDDNITKTEAMKMLLKVKGVEKTQTTDNWQEDYMQTALDRGIISESYSDYNSEASRGWIFEIAASTIKIERDGGLYSDEAL